MTEHTGTITIDCGDKTCDGCVFLKEDWNDDYCHCFKKIVHSYRCSECIENFKEESVQDKINKAVEDFSKGDFNA